MSWISNLYAQTEKAITRKVVEGKVKGVINSIRLRNESEGAILADMDTKVQDSTGIAGELVDDLFALFNKGYTGLNNTILNSVVENEDAVVNLVTNNADALLLLSRAIKMLDTDINKQSAKSLFNNFKEDTMDYLKDDFQKIVDKETDDILNPNFKKLGEIWGKEPKWLLMDMSDSKNDVFEVTENEYNAFSKAYLKQYGKWDESRSIFETRQTSCIHPDKDITTEEFYESLGINYCMING